MKYNPDKHHRKSIRLQGYDYSQPGAYFITICTHNRQCLFGNIVDGKMFLNEIGEFAKQCWLDIPNHYPNVTLDEFVIMPNHIHGIIIINDDIVGVNNNGDKNVEVQNFEPLQYNPQQIQKPPQQNQFQKIIPKSIGSIIRGFKIGVTKWHRENVKANNHLPQQIWQRNYYEHIIRNEKELNTIRTYIINNPLKWELDKNYSEK